MSGMDIFGGENGSPYDSEAQLMHLLSNTLIDRGLRKVPPGWRCCLAEPKILEANGEKEFKTGLDKLTKSFEEGLLALFPFGSTSKPLLQRLIYEGKSQIISIYQAEITGTLPSPSESIAPVPSLIFDNHTSDPTKETVDDEIDEEYQYHPDNSEDSDEDDLGTDLPQPFVETLNELRYKNTNKTNDRTSASASFIVLSDLPQRLGYESDSDEETVSRSAKFAELPEDDSDTEDGGAPPECFLSFLKSGFYQNAWKEAFYLLFARFIKMGLTATDCFCWEKRNRSSVKLVITWKCDVCKITHARTANRAGWALWAWGYITEAQAVGWAYHTVAKGSISQLCHHDLYFSILDPKPHFIIETMRRNLDRNPCRKETGIICQTHEKNPCRLDLTRAEPK